MVRDAAFIPADERGLGAHRLIMIIHNNRCGKKGASYPQTTRQRTVDKRRVRYPSYDLA
jgi:hypothetical protein